MDRLTPEQRHRNMKNIKNKNTKIEVLLRKALWKNGVRYRINATDIIGKPDISIKKYKIAIFCDSEFFHGKDWELLQKQLKRGKNASFWIKKIGRNIERDAEVNKVLEDAGWKVIRFWGKDIMKNLEDCVMVILDVINEVKAKNDKKIWK